MAFSPSDKPAGEELAQHDAVKEEEVLEREGVEQALMQSGKSERGEQIDNVQDKGE